MDEKHHKKLAAVLTAIALVVGAAIVISTQSQNEPQGQGVGGGQIVKVADIPQKVPNQSVPLKENVWAIGNFTQVMVQSGGLNFSYPAYKTWVIFQLKIGNKPLGTGTKYENGNNITYDVKADDLVLTFIYTDTELKEYLTLRSAPKGTINYPFIIPMDGDDPLARFSTGPNGSIYFYDYPGNIVFTMPRPVITDSASHTVYGDYIINSDNIELSIPSGLTYPITVDPTIVTLPYDGVSGANYIRAAIDRSYRPHYMFIDTTGFAGMGFLNVSNGTWIGTYNMYGSITQTTFGFDVDRMGAPHFCLDNGDLYAYNGSRWDQLGYDNSFAVATRSGAGSVGCDLKVDPVINTNAMCYYGGSGSIKDQRWRNETVTVGTWNAEVIVDESVTTIGQYCSLSLDNSDAKMTYWDNTYSDLEMGYNEGGAWSGTTIESTASAGQYNDVITDRVISSAAYGVWAIYNDVTNSDTTVANWSAPATWNKVDLETDYAITAKPSIVRTSLGTPAVAYVKSGAVVIKYTNSTTITWHTMTTNAFPGYTATSVAMAWNESNQFYDPYLFIGTSLGVYAQRYAYPKPGYEWPVISTITSSPIYPYLYGGAVLTGTYTKATPTSWYWDVNEDNIVEYTTETPTAIYYNYGLFKYWSINLTVCNLYGCDNKIVSSVVNYPILSRPSDSRNEGIHTGGGSDWQKNTMAWNSSHFLWGIFRDYSDNSFKISYSSDYGDVWSSPSTCNNTIYAGMTSYTLREMMRVGSDDTLYVCYEANKTTRNTVYCTIKTLAQNCNTGGTDVEITTEAYQLTGYMPRLLDIEIGKYDLLHILTAYTATSDFLNYSVRYHTLYPNGTVLNTQLTGIKVNLSTEFSSVYNISTAADLTVDDDGTINMVSGCCQPSSWIGFSQSTNNGSTWSGGSGRTAIIEEQSYAIMSNKSGAIFSVTVDSLNNMSLSRVAGVGFWLLIWIIT